MGTKIKTLIVVIIGMAFIASCSDDGLFEEIRIPKWRVAKEIKSYVKTHFPNNDISKAFKEKDDGETKYDIHLKGKIELEFNAAYEIISIESNKKLPNSVIPSAILEYVLGNYPNYDITDWELKDYYQQIELNNNLELEFDLKGNYLRMDD